MEDTNEFSDLHFKTLHILNFRFKEQQMKGSQKSRKKNIPILLLKRLVIMCAHKGIQKYVVR